jgi:hypothetical protein
MGSKDSMSAIYKNLVTHMLRHHGPDKVGYAIPEKMAFSSASK